MTRRARPIGIGMSLVLAALPLPAAAASAGPFDLDGDGRITREEFIKGRDARFKMYDHNGDQMISAADFPAGRASDPLSTWVERSIASADLNGDGKVTRDELGFTGTPLFDNADTNGNGIVEGNEIALFKAQLGGFR